MLVLARGALSLVRGPAVYTRAHFRANNCRVRLAHRSRRRSLSLRRPSLSLSLGPYTQIR